MSNDLYRLYDAAGRLLYVGISYSAIQRMAQHRADKEWFGDVARIEIEQVPGDRKNAEKVERAAIIAEKPLHNVVHNMKPARSHKAHEVQWKCHACRGWIEDGDGWITGAANGTWSAYHSSCDPDVARDAVACDYWFDIARIRTVVELEEWVAHLSRKWWFSPEQFRRMARRDASVKRRHMAAV